MRRKWRRTFGLAPTNAVAQDMQADKLYREGRSGRCCRCARRKVSASVRPPALQQGRGSPSRLLRAVAPIRSIVRAIWSRSSSDLEGFLKGYGERTNKAMQEALRTVAINRRPICGSEGRLLGPISRQRHMA